MKRIRNYVGGIKTNHSRWLRYRKRLTKKDLARKPIGDWQGQFLRLKRLAKTAVNL